MNTFDPGPGANIYYAAEQAILRAIQTGTNVDLLFSGLTILVRPASHPGDIVEKYNLQAALRRAGVEYP